MYFTEFLILMETKLDHTFPMAEFSVTGNSKPCRIDRNRNGGGIKIYIN